VKNKFYKLLSLVISLALLLSVCGVGFIASATETEHNYYVKSGAAASNDGLTPETPVPTVADAVTKINAAGLGAGTDVNVWIMQVDDPLAVTDNGTTNPDTSMTVWSTTSETTDWSNYVPSHEAHIIVQAYEYDASNPTYLISRETLGDGRRFGIGGPTTFKNIYLVHNNNQYGVILMHGNSVVFGENVRFGKINTYTAGGSCTLNETYSTAINTGAIMASETYTEEVNITFNSNYVSQYHYSCPFYLYMGTFHNGSYTYKEDMNVIFDNSESEHNVYFGVHSGRTGNTTFEKNLNFNMKSGKSLTFLEGTGTGTVTADAIQVIMSGDSYIGGISTFANVTATKGIWEIKNTTGNSDIISFTDTAGTFTIAEGEKVTITDEDGNEYLYSGNTVKLPAGDYTVSTYVEPTVASYYVLNGADAANDGLTPETPVPTVYDAIVKINASELTSSDTANIYIMQREDWNTDSKVHYMTCWSNHDRDNSGWGWIYNVPEHEVKIVVQAYNYDPENPVYLTVGPNLGDGGRMGIGGPTTFKNITITAEDYQGWIEIRGNDVKFEDTAKFARYSNYNYSSGWNGTFEAVKSLPMYTAQHNVTDTYADNVEITFENEYVSAEDIDARNIFVGANSAGTFTYNKNLTLNFINSNSAPKIVIGNKSGTATVKNNFNINMPTGVSLELAAGAGEFIVNGGIQMILGKGVAFTGDISTFANVTATKGVWQIVNNSAHGDLLDFTSAAGTYTVKSGYEVIATNVETGATEYSSDDTLVLSSGSWKVNVTSTAKYYVKNGADASNDGLTAETPVPTVADAVAKINAAGLEADDVVNIYIMQVDDPLAVSADKTTNMTVWSTAVNTSYWGTYVPTHTARIIVQAYDPDVKTYLASFNTLGTGRNFGIGGPTTFKNIQLVYDATNRGRIELNGNSVTFDSNVTLSKIASVTAGGTCTINESEGLRINTGAIGGIVGTYENEANIIFNNNYKSNHHSNGSNYIYVASYHNGSYTYKDDVNFTFNNSEAAPVIQLGADNSAATIIEKNLNINMEAGASLGIVNGTGGSFAADAIQVMVNDGITYTGDIGSYANVTATKGIWNITNNSADGILKFTDTAGVYDVVSEKKYAYAYDATNNPTTIYYGTDTLNVAKAGSYTVKYVDSLMVIDEAADIEGFIGWIDNGDGTMTAAVSGQELTQYTDYINYRSGLTNTYNKLTSGEKSLNVVYFGGSVTVGTGASDRDATSWRALIGNWLVANFPEANISNINRAAGESGTYLGSYRVERDIISEKPDLLFVEYSINDYYSGASYETAQLQYETIVRHVREALPECDIVTILVTDSGLAEAARTENGGNLHTQAQAHEDMAVIYNIPTIHVGRALADTLPDDWTLEEDWKGVIMEDTVHPLDSGYKIYYNVIKEFMYNSLIIADNSDETVAHTLPELQSDYLLDGNITIIDCTPELIAQSEALGGSGFVCNEDYVAVHTYNGAVCAPVTNTDAEFVLEFTGTELSAYCNIKDTSAKYQIKIDNCDWETRSFAGMNPTVFVDGLTSTTHTVRIKPVMDTLGVSQLNINAFFVRDAAYQTSKTVNYGDANMDGVIDIRDLVNMKKKNAATNVPCPVTDIDKNGVSNSADLVLLRKHLLGLITIG